jgi:hypothetical protein
MRAPVVSNRPLILATADDAGPKPTYYPQTVPHLLFRPRLSPFDPSILLLLHHDSPTG